MGALVLFVSCRLLAKLSLSDSFLFFFHTFSPEVSPRKGKNNPHTHKHTLTHTGSQALAVTLSAS